jgi:hypothetical protein
MGLMLLLLVLPMVQWCIQQEFREPEPLMVGLGIMPMSTPQRPVAPQRSGTHLKTTLKTWIDQRVAKLPSKINDEPSKINDEKGI